MQFIVNVFAWIGVFLALFVAVAAVVSVFAALVCAALAPIVDELSRARRARKVIKASRDYVQRFTP